MPSCKECNENFEITFLEHLPKILPNVISAESFPAPTRCFNCRSKRRLSFKNDRQLFKRVSDNTNVPIITTYAPDSSLLVMQSEELGADGVDTTVFGAAFEPNLNLVEEYKKIRNKVPRGSVSNVGSENCEYNNKLTNSKNTYLSFGSTLIEDSGYITGVYQARDSFDIFKSTNVELCHQSFWIRDIYGCRDCCAVSGSRDLIFCQNCFNCSDCIGCSGLQNKSFCIFNKQYSESEYKAKTTELNLGSHKAYSRLKAESKKFFEQCPVPSAVVKSAEDSSGDFVSRSKEMQNCFSSSDSTVGADLFEASRVSYTFDSDSVYDAELVYSCVNGSFLYQSSFSENCSHCFGVHYSSRCTHSKNLFLCSGLYRKEYCILNTQYSKEVYEILLPQVVHGLRAAGIWGEFFSPDMSDHGYNFSEANYHYPMTKAEVLKWGGRWSDFEPEIPKVSKILSGEEIPDEISAVDDSILNYAIKCEVSGRPFKLIPQELKYYRAFQVPLPRKHPEERYRELLKLRNPFKVFPRDCAKCKKSTLTNINKNRPEPIYCPDCWSDYLESQAAN